MKIFLAGTIDDGKSDNWQGEVVKYFEDNPKYKDLIIYNPRRYDFPEHPKEEDVRAQIRWEQEHLEDADFIVMVFRDGSKSPITLLEMGLYARSGKLIVFCNENYYRYWNVSETAQKYGFLLYEDTDVKSIIDYIDGLYVYDTWLHK